MKLRRSFKITLLVLSFAVFLYSASALTQTTQQGSPYEIVITNVCSSGTIVPGTILMSGSGSPINFTFTTAQLGPGQSFSTNGTTQVTPDRLSINGSFNGDSASVVFDPLVLNSPQNNTETFGGCLQALVTFQGSGDGGTTQPPTGSKPVVEGQTFDQVLAALTANGFQVDIDGSQTNPKIGNVADPQLLRMANAFTAQVIWVSAPGQLRSVINWDNPNVDLDLLVFGFGACFQLNGTGILAEVCDRFPTGPVPGATFAVIVINWSLVNQPFVLSLSS